MTTQLAQYISARTNADASVAAYITGHFKPLATKRNTFLLTPGAVCKHYYFVNKGCLRLFSVNNAGEEGTRYFAFEGSFGTTLPSLIDQQPAFEFTQTIEPSELLAIGRDDFFWTGGYRTAVCPDLPPDSGNGIHHGPKRIYGFQGLDALEKVRWVIARNRFDVPVGMVKALKIGSRVTPKGFFAIINKPEK